MCIYGVNLLAIVDSKKRFLWTCGGLRGSMSESRAFRESAWYEAQKGSHPKLRPGFCLLADGGLALETWLLKPYPEEQVTTVAKRLYNYLECSPRVVVEHAFGQLKERWRVLHHGVSVETEFVPYVVEACVRLHNFLIDMGDGWTRTVDAQAGNHQGMAADALEDDTYELTVQMRDALAQALFEEHSDE